MKIKYMQAILIVVLFIFVLCVPAGAGQLSIDIDKGWMTGNADRVSLSEVMKSVANKTGCKIFIDETLKDDSISFTLNGRMPIDKAISRIVRPHSYAIVYSAGKADDEPVVNEVWIFCKGKQHSASYVAIHNTRSGLPPTDTQRGTAATTITDRTATAEQTGRTIKEKNILRRDLTVKKSAFGTPVTEARNGSRGPDYRLNATGMKKAYEHFLSLKREEKSRLSKSVSRQSQANNEKNRYQYQSDRNQQLKKQALESLNEQQ